jgi:COP9 signalosome complex subunit 3
MDFDSNMKGSKKTKISNYDTVGRHIDLENLEKLDPVENGTLYFQYICNVLPTKSSLKYIYKFVKNYSKENFPNLKIEEWKVLGTMLDQMAFRENAHKNILKILKELIKKIQTTPHHLTFLHPIFAKHCLLAKTYSYAKDILANDIQDFDLNVNVLDFLLYHYYGGMLAIGLKDFEKALIYFRRAIAAPTNRTVSAVMIESYKKYVLVSILLHGSKQPLPSYTDEVITKKLRKSVSCKDYIELGNTFNLHSSEMNRNISHIKKLSTFHSNKNKGLVKQCTRSYIRQVIQKLTQTYVTMSFQEIATEIGLNDEPNANKVVEAHLLSMIEDNKIFAYINHNNGGRVSFYDDPERYDTNETMEKINDCIHTVAQLNEKVLKYNHDIKKEHIIEMTKMNQFKESSSSGGGGVGDYILVKNAGLNEHAYSYFDQAMQFYNLNGYSFGVDDNDDDNDEVDDMKY